MEATDIIRIWKGIYLFDLLRYLIPASLAYVTFWVIGKKSLKHLFIQKTFPKQDQLHKEFAYSMSTVVIFSVVGVGIYMCEESGITRIYYEITDYGISYAIFSFTLTLVFHDFYFYWTHRLMHHRRIFRHVHRVHHESTNPSPWAAYSFHPWEALIQAMVLPVMVFIFPLHPVVIFLFLAYMITRNVIGHLGYEIFPKGWTKNKWLGWTTAVTHHNIHHENFNSNYGLYFTWWDRWMKTEDEKYHQSFDHVRSRAKTGAIAPSRKRSLTLPLLLLSHFSIGQSIEGKWMTFNEITGSPLSVIEIARTGVSIEGKVIRIFLQPDQGDDPVCSKCTGERKNRRVIDMNFLWGFKKDGDAWSDGKILDPQGGKVYTSKLWLEDEYTLKVRGYGGMLDLFYRTQTWKREGSAKGRSPAGFWSTIDDTFNKVKSRVEIIERNGELLGYIRKIYLLPHEGTDPVCVACDGELKNTKIVGMKILSGFEFTGDKWEGGQILDPGNGNIYSSTIWLVSEDELNVRGYIGPFYRTQVWKRQSGL